MKSILAIAAAASLALLAGCEQQPTDEATAPEAQDQAAAPQEQPATGEPGAVSFSQLDTDGDGNISTSEAQAMPQLEQNFQQADRNQDGMVDQSEFAQFETGGDAGMAPGDQAPMEQPPAGQPSPGMESAPPAGEQPAPSDTQQQ